MKKLLSKIIYKMIQSDALFKIFKNTIFRFSCVVLYERHKFECDRILASNPNILKIFKELKVLNGPFKGLKYPNIEAYGSAVFPKLLGSYEIELKQIFDDILKEKYVNIINVGCAEGYYAIGLALKFPEAKVYAYDISDKALVMCRKMGEINGVSERLVLGSSFTTDNLINFDLSHKSLIISDCEGFEKRLFTKKSVKHIKNCDVLIETHDLYNYSISYYLEEIFKNTHELTRIISIDDLQKVKTYKYDEIDNLSIIERKTILEEMRERIMEWQFYRPKNPC